MRVALLLVPILTLAAGCKKDAPPAPAVPDTFGVIPAFAFVDAGKAPYGSADLAGKVWIANTFFTSCRSICPPLMLAVSELRTRLADTPVAFVSITIDPDNDTPDVLTRYAVDRLYTAPNWRFITSSYEATRALVVDGFRTALGQAPKDRSDGTDIEHSAKLFLVDQTGHLRGWFSSDAKGLDAIEQAARQLLK